MKPNSLIRALFSAIILHAFAIFFLARGNSEPEVASPARERSPLLVRIETDATKSAHPHASTTASTAEPERTSARKIDPRPSYMRGPGTLAVEEPANPFGNPGATAKALLELNPKLALAFDLLAEQIAQSLDYPRLLYENGVEGTASLDLYFDGNGEVSEERSRFGGSHRALRGVFVRASRSGLERWYATTAKRLAKTEFRNQHFRADFSISYAQKDASSLEKEGEGAYHLIRRHFNSICAVPGGVDLVCLAVKGYGVARNAITGNGKREFAALLDILDGYDEMGLRGIRARVSGG